MTVIVFLIDTSASMMQKSYLGTTYLDFARLTVEQFLKQRQRDPASNGDRYMLMTFEEYPQNIKSGWKESQRIFNEQLKSLKAKGMANFESSLESVMRLLTINRMHTGNGAGIENYGFGRFPSYAEHVVIVPVIDGSELPYASSNSEVHVPKPRLPGGDFTADAFRWDQRLFPIVLRLSGHQQMGNYQPGHPPPPDYSIAETYATQMGGRSFAIMNHRTLFLCIEAIMQRIQCNGVFMRFQKHGPDPAPPPSVPPDDVSGKKQNCEGSHSPTPTAAAAPSMEFANFDGWADSLVLVKTKSTGNSFWPIPEAFWPDTVRDSLPSRRAHPVVLFTCDRAEPLFNQEFPLDKYELDSSSPLVRYMLSRQEPNLCWQIYIEGSYKEAGIGLPFGYIKISSGSTVNLVVMPYNYPKLLALLNEVKEAKERLRMIASVDFQQRFYKYQKTVPSYYYTYLKKQLSRLKIAPPSLEEANTKLYGHLNLGTQQLKMKQQGQLEYDLACQAVLKHLTNPANNNTAMFGTNPATFVKVSRARALCGKGSSLTDCRLRPALALSTNRSQLPDTYRDLNIFVVCDNSGGSGNGSHSSMVPPSQQFKNPFEIPRANLCTQLDKMRINFDQQVHLSNLHVFQGGPPGQKIKLQHAEDLANLPISKMGVYEDYMKSLIAIGMGPKRELEPQAARPHAFGNPFKLDKKNMSIVDEVGDAGMAASTSTTTEGQLQQQQAAANSAGMKRCRAASEAGTAATSATTAPPTRLKRRAGPIDPQQLVNWRHRISAVDKKDKASSSGIGAAEEEEASGGTDVSDVASEPGEMPSSSAWQREADELQGDEELDLRLAADEEDEEEGAAGDGEDAETEQIFTEPSTTMTRKRQRRSSKEEEEDGKAEENGKMLNEEDEEEEAEEDDFFHEVLARAGSHQQHSEKATATTNGAPPSKQKAQQNALKLSSVSASQGDVVRKCGAGRTSPKGALDHGPSKASSTAFSSSSAATSSTASASTSFTAPPIWVREARKRPAAQSSMFSDEEPASKAEKLLLEKKRQVRQICRKIEPKVSVLADRVAELTHGLSRKRARELLELGQAEARRFKRHKLSEAIGQHLLLKETAATAPQQISTTTNNAGGGARHLLNNLNNNNNNGYR